MTILHIVATMNKSAGGISQALRNIIKPLSLHGIQSEVLCFDNPSLVNSDSIIIHNIGPSISPYQYCKNLSPWLNKYGKNYSMLIIHGMWLHNSYGVYKYWKKATTNELIKSKLYLMPHGMLDPYFQKSADRRFKAYRNILFWKYLEKKVINNCSGLLFTCEEELKLAKKTFRNYKPREEVVIGLGIPKPPEYSTNMLEEFKSQVFDNLPEDKYLLFMSRIDQKKGLDLLIDAYLKLSISMELPLLVIAGPGLESSFGKKMKKLASSNSNIIFYGMLTGNAKWAAIYNCEAFILPSHQENFGIVVAEALGCGKPVLITNKINIFRDALKYNSGIVGNDTLDGISYILETWVSLSDQEKKIISSSSLRTFVEKFEINKISFNMAKSLKRICDV